MSQIYPHQKAVYEELLLTAKTYFERLWTLLPMRPRFNRLIVGESGSGKSFLARAVARELDLPIWDCTATNWMPLGCSERGARPSWLDVASFVTSHGKGIIFLDEVDKLGKIESPWMTCTRAEIFALLDQRVPVNLTLDPLQDEDSVPVTSLTEVQACLRECTFVCAAGAFQNLWDINLAPPIGFGSGIAEMPKLPHHRLWEVLPLEVLNRFSPPVLTLPRLQREDYEALLKTALSMSRKAHRRMIKTIAESTMDDALRDRLGCRWIEQIMLEVASELTNRKQQKPLAGKISAPVLPDLQADLSEPIFIDG